MRWLLTIFIALVVLSAALPWLERLGIGRLPGDVTFSLFGKRVSLPFASTALMLLAFFVLARLVK
jgi:hypothetical protein